MSTPLTPYQRRLVRYLALVKEVTATLGKEAGYAWLKAHKDMSLKSLFSVENEWKAEKGRRSDQAAD